MGIDKNVIVQLNSKNITGFAVLLTMLIYHACAYASDWKIIPSFTLSESYSDNINLVPSGRKKGAFVTELSPGISIRRKTARNRLNLDYRMQNLHNAGGNSKFDIFHQLQFNSNSEIFRNALFLDLNSSIDQQNATNLFIANDNLSGSRNRTDVITYGVSPYWTPHLNGYADGEVRFNYNKLVTGNSLASDTENFDYSVRLNSGRRFSRMTWFVNYDNRDQKRQGGNDVRFQDTLAELRGHFNRYFNVFSQMGHSDNTFQSSTGRNKNGFFYTFGAKWKPSERFSLEGGLGNNSFVTVSIMPTRHMHLITTYRNDDIGTNTGNVWNASFDFTTKRSLWKASYSEDTTTTQTALSDIQSFTLVDAFGNAVIDPVTQQSVQADTTLPTLVDEVFIRKKGEISVAYRTGKSDVNVRFVSENRVFQVSERKNDVIAVSGSWDWRFARRSAFFIRPSWQQTTREVSKDNRLDIALGLSRRIPITLGRRGRLNARLEYRYINQSSDININEYIENRITASLLFTL